MVAKVTFAGGFSAYEVVVVNFSFGAVSCMESVGNGSKRADPDGGRKQRI